MTDTDQCIICLDSLQPPSSQQPDAENGAGPASVVFPARHDPELEILDPRESDLIATLSRCNHVIHDRCIRAWAETSNTCPICRTTFNEVLLSETVDGPMIDSYAVQDRKQTAEFDIRQWLDENPEEQPEEEEATPCPICESAEREDVLLLCDNCDAAYHTHCVGLESVPRGQWYCLECADAFAGFGNEAVPSSPEVQEIPPPPPPANTSNTRPRPFPRTRERQRRARRQARSIEWQGAWGQIAGRIYDATDIDLDNHEGDDALEDFRRSQQLRERELRDYQQWQQRLDIASRQGARDVFARNIPAAIGQQLERVQPIQETREERRAWGALDRAREVEGVATPTTRKRKSRSVTASPREPVQEPERKLKRPRTRRLPLQGEPSTSASSPIPAPTPHTNGSTSTVRSPTGNPEGPTFLTSLLKEVQMSTPSDDEGPSPGPRIQTASTNLVEASSPVTSPSPSAHSSPRALSTTPPPYPRPSSPTLSLSSYVEPRFPKANYSPTRSAGEHSDSDSRSNGAASDIRQPRPRRPQRQRSINQSRSQDTSPTRSLLSLEAKQRISGIVRSALNPHWRAQELTSEQYASINRDVSRKLYEDLRDPSALDDDSRKTWEKRATTEVARAVSDLKA